MIRQRVKGNQFFVARDAANRDKIVGILEYEAHTHNIFSIGRNPSYARSGVGQLLWNKFLSEHSNHELQLYVRKSNPAKAIYKKWGFKKANRVNNFYHQPAENGVLLKRQPSSA